MQRILPCLIVLLSLLNTASFGTDKSNKPLEIISINPFSQATFNQDEKCTVEFRYNLPSDGKFHIFVQPFTNGKRTKGAAINGSRGYSNVDGVSRTGIGLINIEGNALVDEIKVNMTTEDVKTIIATISRKVKLEWVTEDKNQIEFIQWAREYSLDLKAAGKVSEHGVNWYRPASAEMLGADKPNLIRTVPKFRKDGQKYLAFTFGNAEENKFLGVIDFDTKDKSKYFEFDLRLDLDQDGDLAEESIANNKMVWLKVPYKDGTVEDFGIKVYSIQSNSSRLIAYQVLSGRVGQIKTGNFDVGILVIDSNCNGIFNDPDDVVLVDKDLDGRIESKNGEQISLFNEFNLPGAIYKVKEIDSAGKHITLELVRLNPETAKKPVTKDKTSSNKVKSGRQEKGRFAVGRTSPRIRYKGIDNKPVMIDKMKGKVVLIDFWATWCGPCTAEMPTVISAYEQLHDSGFEIIGISLDKNRDTMVKYINDNNMPWPQFYDGKGWNNRLAKLLGIKSIPATILVDKKGVVRYIDLRGERMIEAAKQLLAE